MPTSQAHSPLTRPKCPASYTYDASPYHYNASDLSPAKQGLLHPIREQFEPLASPTYTYNETQNSLAQSGDSGTERKVVTNAIYNETTTINLGPINPTGRGTVIEDSASYYVGIGGGVGNSTLILDNGTVAIFNVVEVGVGFGAKGASIQGGTVEGVFYADDFSGSFLNVNGNLFAGGGVSYSPLAPFTGEGSTAMTGGLSPGAGISGSYQYYELIAVFPAEPSN